MSQSTPFDPYLHDSYPPPPISPSLPPTDHEERPDYYAALYSSNLLSSSPPSPSTSFLPLSTSPRFSDQSTQLLDYPRRPFSTLKPRDSSFTCNTTTSDDDLTRIGSDSSPWQQSFGSAVALNKLGDREAEGIGLVHSPQLDQFDSEKHPSDLVSTKIQRRRRIISLVGLSLIILAVIIIIVIITMRQSDNQNLQKTINSADGTLLTAAGHVSKLWGTNGDKITTENGTTFEYKNPLGGTWVAIPFNDTAKCQDDSPPLNKAWDYSNRRILGVNLGGWLVLEPFITPYMFEPFNDPNSNPQQPPTVVDEWSLSLALGDKLASTLEEHYKTFITEEDFMEIAAAGLNWVRIPVGWWMIETWQGEPFLEGVSFKYFLKAIQWARKYGLRVNLDFHAAPGSQNGFNHSGKLGAINFLVGLMGIANAQRTLNYIRTLTQFISQPQYVNVVPMFSILNEALVQKIGSTQIRSFYLQVYQMMRSITGYGMGKGPMMVIHDGFQGEGAGHGGWAGFLKGADRLGLDTHTYFAFDKQSNDSLGYNSFKPCTYWSKGFNQTNADFGFNFAGEYSLAINDCGLWLNNIGVGSRYDGTYPNSTNPDLTNFPAVGSCDSWKDYRTWSSDMKNHIADLAATSQDAMQNSFFWTWKISRSIRIPSLKPNPLWDYQLGLREGWIRSDARKSVGACNIVATKEGSVAPVQPWSGQFLDWQIGNSTSTNIDPGQLAMYSQWPPNQIFIQQGQDPFYPEVRNLPQYVPTGTIVKLKPDQPDSKFIPVNTHIDPGDGWANPSDRAGWYVPIQGCQYPNPWAGSGLPPPSGPFCQSNTP